MKEATEQSIWIAHKYTTNISPDQLATTLPPLQTSDGIASSTEDKCRALQSTFFPKPPLPDLDNIPGFNYPDELPFPPISQEDIQEVLRDVSPHKAPGPSGIPNIAIQRCAQTIIPYILAITKACLHLGYHPTQWKHFKTITLRKPGKPDYSIPKAYRPIALEDTLSKIVEAVMARKLAMMAEQFDLLPPNHFGGRPGRNTTDAILYLVQKIKDAWRRKEHAAVLFLDIAQAFPSVSHTRLIHNLRKAGIPASFISWLQSFLTDRTTTLQFDDFSSDPIAASHGIPQGSPISPILYLFYSADLLRLTPTSKTDDQAGYIDDTALVASAPTMTEVHQLLDGQAGMATGWSGKHACRFDIPKFQLLDLPRPRTFVDTAPPIIINGHTIHPQKSAKYLGIVIDHKLKWDLQVESAIAKGTASVLAISRLSKSTFGLPHQYIRQLYIAVTVPRMLYGLVAWYKPVRPHPDNPRRHLGSVGVANKLGKVQRLAAKIITGAFRTTPTTVLEYHAGLPPIRLYLNFAVHRSTLRLATLPPGHPLCKPVTRCSRLYPQRHRSPLHELFHAFPHIEQVETIDPTPMGTVPDSFFSTSIAATRTDGIDRAHHLENNPPSPEATTTTTATTATTSHPSLTNVCIYTDGSRFQNGVGAAAVQVSLDPAKPHTIRQLHLGSATHHTVFEAELVGVILALDILRSLPHILNAQILLDNQPVIHALKRRGVQSGQYLIDLFHSELKDIKKFRPGLRLHLNWVPGHEGVDGNELADQKAKDAARGASSPLPHRLHTLCDLPVSIAALQDSAKKDLRTKWATIWATDNHAQRIRSFDPTPPGKKILHFLRQFPKADSSIMVQLRSAHAGLNAYLFRFNAVDSPLCTLCQVPETVDHYLFSCRKYLQPRSDLRSAVHPKPFTKATLLSVRAYGPAILGFVHKTERFPHYTS